MSKDAYYINIAEAVALIKEIVCQDLDRIVRATPKTEGFADEPTLKPLA